MRINIIGAGITGLAAAYFLSRRGHHVNVFDSAPEVGGLAGFFPVEGTYLEKYYHHSFTGHRELISLMDDLKIEKNLFFVSAKMGLFYGGRLYSFVTPKDLLSFAPLKLVDRVRLGVTSLIMMRIKDWRELEKKSALEWLHTYSGGRACKVVWEPLLKMKFGDDYDQISAAWLWNRVVDRKGLNQKRVGKELLGYIKGGYKTLFDALLSRIQSFGGEIHTAAPVQEIYAENGNVSGMKVNNRIFTGDVVLSTISIPSFLKIAPVLPEKYITSLNRIKYQGSICLVLKLRKALSEYYWINVSDPNCPFVGVIEHTNLISPDNYGNSHMVYLTKYSSPGNSIFSKSDQVIFRDFVSHLTQIFPKFKEDNVEDYWIFKDRFSQPVFVQNYSEIMPAISTPIKNLYLVTTAQIYPQSRSVNSSIAKAHDFVTEILESQ